MADQTGSTVPRAASFTLGSLMLWVTTIALACGLVVTVQRLRSAETELAKLREEVGYLGPTRADQVAAVRAQVLEPLTYQFRVRVPERQKYRLVYSSIWPVDSDAPDWFGALSVPSGESTVIVRVLRDPRDDQWKIAAICRSELGTRRIGTVLPEPHVALFRSPQEWSTAGVSRVAHVTDAGDFIRLVENRMIRGEEALLFGARPRDQDAVGVFAQLEPDVGAL
ncbi:MAG: hypothetical protein AAFX06_20300 [Planctomycetota bacterium]